MAGLDIGAISIGLVLALFGVPLCALAVRPSLVWAARSGQPPWCGRCGYSLFGRAEAPRCPECGVDLTAVVPRSDPPGFHSWRFRLVLWIVGSGLCFLGVGYLAEDTFVMRHVQRDHRIELFTLGLPDPEAVVTVEAEWSHWPWQRLDVKRHLRRTEVVVTLPDRNAVTIDAIAGTWTLAGASRERAESGGQGIAPALHALWSASGLDPDTQGEVARQASVAQVVADATSSGGTVGLSYPPYDTSISGQTSSGPSPGLIPPAWWILLIWAIQAFAMRRWFVRSHGTVVGSVAVSSTE